MTTNNINTGVNSLLTLARLIWGHWVSLSSDSFGRLTVGEIMENGEARRITSPMYAPALAVYMEQQAARF